MGMKPLLAAKIDDVATLTYPGLASPKLDGIRALVLDGKLVSRTLKPIPNDVIRTDLSHKAFTGLDGELIVGPPTAKDVFNVSTSAVMRSSGQPDYTYAVFDDFSHSGGFKARYDNLAKRVNDREWPTAAIELVQHTLVENVSDLMALENLYVSQGYEGLMWRSLDGIYKQGRSTAREGILLKLKRFEDDEATILDMIEEMENLNEKTKNALGQSERSSHKENLRPKGTMGAIRVRNTAGQEFEIGTGFTAKDRADFWQRRRELIGQTIKYKHQPIGAKDLPRFPSFIGLRAD
jgi:DNA ligase-1